LLGCLGCSWPKNTCAAPCSRLCHMSASIQTDIKSVLAYMLQQGLVSPVNRQSTVDLHSRCPTTPEIREEYKMAGQKRTATLLVCSFVRLTKDDTSDPHDQGCLYLVGVCDGRCDNDPTCPRLHASDCGVYGMYLVVETRPDFITMPSDTDAPNPSPNPNPNPNPNLNPVPVRRPVSVSPKPSSNSSQLLVVWNDRSCDSCCTDGRSMKPGTIKLGTSALAI
jgi:hypothetical protein